MTTESPDLAPASPTRRPFVLSPRILAWTILVVPALALLVPYFIVVARGLHVSAYPFAGYLPGALGGLYVACVGVLQLAWADTGRNPLGNVDPGKQTRTGAWQIALGLWLFADEGLPLLVRPSDRASDLLFQPWLLLWPLIVAAPFAIPALWQRLHRQSLPEHPSTPQVPQVPRVSRRTLLFGAGVAAIGATGIGTLLVRLPTMVPHLKLHGDLFFPKGLAWSPDGRRIATTNGLHTAQIWNAATGEEVARHDQPIVAGGISWSPDGRRVVSATGGNTAQLQVWDAATGRTLLSYTDAASDSVAWSPRDNRIATTTIDNGIVIVDATTGKDLLRFGANAYGNSLVWSPDARMLAAPSRGGVGLWDAASGRHIGTIATDLTYLGAIAWSPDGTHLATANQDGTARVYRVHDGVQLTVYRGHSGEVEAVAWSPDGRFVVSGGDDDTAQVWSAETGRHVYTWNGHMGAVKVVAWQPRGSLIASGAADSTVQIWQPTLS